MKFLITGGCGFIGSSFIRAIVNNPNYNILNIDAMTNSSSIESLDSIKFKKNYQLKKNNICEFENLKKIIFEYNPDFIINFAAESHVDNSIKSPIKSIHTNIIGTFNLLEITRLYNFKNSNNEIKFIHISTDEVYGSLSKNEKSFDERSKFNPNSPYSASKASSDHLVRAWNKTYGLKTITTNCCNNFGPWQFPEKLIPVIIYNCIYKYKIPVYGNGLNIREWIYVDDHAEIINQLLTKGHYGETYNIGSGIEISNLDLVKLICKIFNTKFKTFNYLNLINFVEDRKGHDFRYSINSNKILDLIDDFVFKDFEFYLQNTVDWYLENIEWLNSKVSIFKKNQYEK